MRISNLIVALAIMIFAATSCMRTMPRSGKMEFKNSVDSVSYALGYIEANQFKKQFDNICFDMDSTDMVALAKAISKTKLRDGYVDFRTNQFDGINEDAFYKGFLNQMAYNKSYFTEMSADMYLRKVYNKVKTAKDSVKKVVAKENLAKSKKFLADNRKAEGVVVTESGLQYKVLRKGDGKVATRTDKVRCVYHGTLPDGTVFDSSLERKDTATFRVNGVIKGWTEALLMMKEGAKYRLFVPSDLAYGERGSGKKIGSNQALIFDIDLVEVVKPKGRKPRKKK